MDTVPQESNANTLNPTLITRSIWVAVCGRPEVEGFRIWIRPNSTFGDIKREIVSVDPINLSNSIVLQPNYGVRPYWTHSEPTSRITNSCRMLYLVPNGESESFLVCLVRTASLDYPLVIVDSNRPSTVSQAIESAQPDLTGRMVAVTDHSGKTSIRDAQLDFIGHTSTRPPTFPTIFSATMKEGPAHFLSDEPPGSVPPLLQTTMVHCEYLLRQVTSLEVFRSQTTHLLQAARHLILSLADALKYLFDANYPELEDALIVDSSLAELLPVAPSLTGNLQKLLDRIEQIMRALRSEEPNFEGIKDIIDHTFNQLCGDFPGAVTVRWSYLILHKLARRDYEDLLQKYNDRNPPEGVKMTTRVLDIQRRVVDALKEELGSKHPDTLKAMLNVSTTYTDLGRYADAKGLQSSAFKTLQKLLGERHLDTLYAARGLAFTFNALGRFSDAEKFGKIAMSGMRPTLGPGHPDTNQTISNLAITYHKQNRNSEAEELQKVALDALKKVPGKAHPSTLEAARQLSLVYVAQGRYTEAEEIQKGVIDNFSSTLGYEHLASHRARLSLASTYYKQGRYSDAKALQVESLEPLKSKLGEMHPEVLVAMRELSVTKNAMGQYSEAEKLLSDACNGLNTTLGEAHVDTIISQLHLTSVYYNEGRYMEAETHQLQRLETLKSQIGQKHLLTLQAMRLLALTYCAEGRYTEATELQVDTVQRLRETLGSKHPDVFIAMRERAWTEAERGNAHDAMEIQRAALEGLQLVLGETHPETLITRRDYSSLFNAMSNYSEARIHQEIAVQGLEKQLGSRHPDTITAMLSLAEAYNALGRRSGVQELQGKAMDGLMMTEVRQHAGILSAMYRLSLKSKSADAKSLARKIERIRQNGSTNYVLVDLFQLLCPIKKSFDEDELMGSEDEEDEGLDLD